MQLTSSQRKIVYGLVILVMLAPILYLGMPAGGGKNVVGKLADLRQKYELGETSLGDVPPASATMNLLLLGLRGIACNVLWQQAIDQKQKKDWGGLRATTESIILLQPHFRQVWEFQAWNLAYNVSAEWDGIADRYHWVKEGAKFMIRGTKVNKLIPDLNYEVGRIIGQKIGHSDEWKTFRKYYYHDPDHPTYNHAFAPDSPENSKVPADSDLNPDLKDNYLTSSDWFKRAIDLVKANRTQHREAPVLYYSRPYLAWIQCADAFNREGLFNDQTRLAWEQAYDKWMIDFGRNEIFNTSVGKICLNFNPEIMEAFVKDDKNEYTLLQKQQVADSMRKMCNFNDWRERAESEKQEAMKLAHYELAEGKRLFTREQDLTGSLEMTEKGLIHMQEALRQYPDLADTNRDIVEESTKGIIIYKHIHELLGKDVPADYPLKSMELRHPEQYSENEALYQKTFGGG